MGLLSIVVMFPFLWMFHLSFKTNKQIFAFPPQLFFEPTLTNYTTLFDEVFTPGQSRDLTLTVPDGLVTTTTFARFRLSHLQGLSYDGPAVR